MARLMVFAVLTALVMVGCGNGHTRMGCAGAAVIVSAVPSSPVGGRDGGTDADAPTDGGAGEPSCSGRCIDYLEALRVAIEASTPSSCMVQLMDGTSLACLPISSAGGCVATVDEASVLQAQIGDYLAVSWPELDGPSLDTCLCHID
jgi:hypothetical protein